MNVHESTVNVQKDPEEGKKFEVKKEKPSALIGTSQQPHGFLRTGFSQS